MTGSDSNRGRSWTRAAWLLWVSCRLFMFLCVVGFALAQNKAASTQAQIPEKQAVEVVEQDPLDRLTPYGSVRGFLRAARREDYSRAAQYLDTRQFPARAEELARQLQTVLDFATTVNLNGLSQAPEGDLTDGLSLDLERIGTVEINSGELEILVSRVQRGDRPQIWLFSSETLRAVPEASQWISSVDFRRHLARPLVDIEFFSRPLWAWIAILLGLALAVGLASVATRVITLMLRPLIHRLAGSDEDRRLLALAAPLRVVLLGIAIGLLSRLGVSLLARQSWARAGITLAVLGLGWLLSRLSDIASEWATRRLQQSCKSGSLALIGLSRRLLKATVFVLSVLVLLHVVGVDLTAILAGLGLGGVAIAFAAQKTIENLFGGISVISDEPIRVGDFCRTADHMGTVEDIGLRSTRIRTLDRTVVSIPNGQLAAVSIENFTMRDRFWFHPTVSLRRETTAAQLRWVLAGITNMLLSHPKVNTDGVRVRFVGFGSSSLDVEIFSYVQETELPLFLAVQEDLLLRIMDIIEAGGTRLAFPSQTVYFEEDKLPIRPETVRPLQV